MDMADIKPRGGCLRQHLPPLQASVGSGAGQAGHAALCPHPTGPSGKWDSILQVCLIPALEATDLTHLGAADSRAQPQGAERLGMEAGLTRLSRSCEAASDMDVEGAGDQPKL